MATLIRGKTFSPLEKVTAAKLHDLVDEGHVTNISNADCSASMALANSKLANIIDAGKVSGNSLFNLASTPSGAGYLPAANLLAAFPVGSIYINVTGANPGTFLGGTWVAFGSGKVLVGLDSEDEAFDTAEKPGGEKTHILTTNEMPAHTHTYNGFGGSTLTPWAGSSDGKYLVQNTSSAGNGDAHNNLQPYIVVYFWKRTV